MSFGGHTPRYGKRLAARTGAGMYGAASADAAIQKWLLHSPTVETVTPVAALAAAIVIWQVGPRLPRLALAACGPLGVAVIAQALATTPGIQDTAALYALPVLWTSVFFGDRGAVLIVSCVAVAQAVALMVLPGSAGYPGRWVDVMVSSAAVAIVVRALEHRNEGLMAQLREQADTDPLTGLLNRRGFDERAAAALARARRDVMPVAMVTFDIDHFKAVNDKRGHEIGDRVLSRIGMLLGTLAREIDIVARFGGEEFVVLLPDAGADGAQAFAERVRQALVHNEWGDLPKVRLSAGVASGQSESVEILLRRADNALYDAKDAGRDCIRVWGADYAVA